MQALHFSQQNSDQTLSVENDQSLKIGTINGNKTIKLKIRQSSVATMMYLPIEWTPLAKTGRLFYHYFQAELPSGWVCNIDYSLKEKNILILNILNQEKWPYIKIHYREPIGAVDIIYYQRNISNGTTTLFRF